jgi:type IV secretory pathway TraG/TraD family ATPase VirD4
VDLAQRVEELSLRNKEDAAKALHLDLQSTISGEWGAVLCCDTSGREINLLDIIRKNEILFVDLPTEGKSIQSTRVGKLLLQELIQISGYRKTHPHLRNGRPFCVYVDEFDAFATPSFATFLNKGRSSDFMIHIAHQTLSDLKRIDGGEGWFMGQVLGNINNRFIFRTDDPGDADLLSSIFGTELTRQYTRRVTSGLILQDSDTGEGSMREVYEFRVHPNELKELPMGECIFSSKTSGRLKRLKIELPKPEKYFQALPTLRGEIRPEAEPTANKSLDRIDLEIVSRVQPKPVRKVKPILEEKNYAKSH